jgi:hypothetical protein
MLIMINLTVLWRGLSWDDRAPTGELTASYWPTSSSVVDKRDEYHLPYAPRVLAQIGVSRWYRSDRTGAHTAAISTGLRAYGPRVRVGSIELSPLGACGPGDPTGRPLPRSRMPLALAIAVNTACPSRALPHRHFDRLTRHDGWHNDSGFGRPTRRSG